jgi:hypothetical protein
MISTKRGIRPIQDHLFYRNSDPRQHNVMASSNPKRTTFASACPIAELKNGARRESKCSWFHEFINTLLTRWFINRNLEQLILYAGASDIVQKNPDHLVALKCPHSYL